MGKLHQLAVGAAQRAPRRLRQADFVVGEQREMHDVDGGDDVGSAAPDLDARLRLEPFRLDDLAVTAQVDDRFLVSIDAQPAQAQAIGGDRARDLGSVRCSWQLNLLEIVGNLAAPAQFALDPLAQAVGSGRLAMDDECAFWRYVDVPRAR